MKVIRLDVVRIDEVAKAENGKDADGAKFENGDTNTKANGRKSYGDQEGPEMRKAEIDELRMQFVSVTAGVG